MRWWMCVVLVSAGCTKGSDTVDTQDTDVVDTDTDVTDTDTDVDTDTDTQETGESGLVDADGDGYDISTDCDDADPAVHPDAKETCNGVDDDCDGATDEDFDVDADGYFSWARCKDGDDCNDDDDTIHPGATETPNDGIDQDCDGKDLVEGDDDLDGHVAEAKGGDDCDDTRADVHPGHVDWWNDGVDSDCDGKDGTTEDLAKMDVTLDGDSSWGDLLGLSMTTCDIDEDGSDDLIVTAPFGDSYAGEVEVFYGGDAATWGSGMTTADAGTLITSGSYFFGMGLSCADLDGDGHVDLAVGRGEIEYPSYSLSTDLGVVLFYGDGNRLASSLTDTSADAELSYDLGAVSGQPYVLSSGFFASDVDMDGASELVLVVQSSQGTNDPSQVWILPGGRYSSGSLDGDVVAIDSTKTDDLTTATAAGDLDGNGRVDLVVGETNDGDNDTATPWDGEVDFLDAPSSNTSVGAARYASLVGTTWLDYGYDFAVGDFDGDGVSDGAGSALLDNTDADYGGAVYIHHDLYAGLVATGIDATTDADAHVYGEFSDGILGYRISAPGDVDADGTGDLVVTELNGNLAQTGRVYVLGGGNLSGDLTASDAAILAFDGEAQDAGTGATMTSGDYDGDGMIDLVVGAYALDSGGTGNNTGRVYVILSSNRD